MPMVKKIVKKNAKIVHVNFSVHAVFKFPRNLDIDKTEWYVRYGQLHVKDPKTGEYFTVDPYLQDDDMKHAEEVDYNDDDSGSVCEYEDEVYEETEDEEEDDQVNEETTTA